MFRKDNSNKLNIPKVNESVDLLNKILRIGFVLIVVVGIYALTLIFKEWGIFTFLKTLIKVLSPLFFGFVIAWLFNPIVTWLKTKKINRILGTVIVYVIFLGLLYLMVSSIFPLITDQVNDLVSSIPKIVNNIKEFIDNFFKGISSESFNLDSVKIEIFDYINTFGKNIASSLPTKVMTFLTSLFSGLGTFGLSLIIGFYMLFNFDNVSKTMIGFLPKSIRKTSGELLYKINETLFGYVQGTLFVSFIIFITSYIGFLLLGVKSPLLFALFCGITNIIPYVGPFIGGTPVALVTLTQNVTLGILVIIYMIAIQWLESLILQPIIMSKAMKLHPVTIIIGLLVFGHFFGMLGMIVATPIIATCKTIFIFLNEKYELTKWIDEEF